MEFNFAEKVNILGQDYTIEVKMRNKDVLLSGVYEGVNGCTDFMNKRLVIRDQSLDLEWRKNNQEATCIKWMKKVLRHEIVHAFLMESGLDTNSKYGTAWARNEEMVDWIAFQGPKISQAWAEAGAL